MVLVTRLYFFLVADMGVIPSHCHHFKMVLLKYNIPGTTCGAPVTSEELILSGADSFEYL